MLGREPCFIGGRPVFTLLTLSLLSRASQKPTDDFYKTFKANFPQLNQNAAPSTASPRDPVAASEPLESPLNARYVPFSYRRPSIIHAHCIQPTPRAGNDQWAFTASSGFTPSMMDPDSQNFSMFANQMPAYYTPTPGGNNTNTFYQNRPGDMHTPGLGLGMGTPMSMPTSDCALPAGQQFSLPPTFQPHLHHGVPQQQFSIVNPYQMHHSQGFVPQQFPNPAPFDINEAHQSESPIGDTSMDTSIHSQHESPEMLFHTSSMAPPTLPPSADNQFRFHVTLGAQTAMVRHPDEVPVTYLNKGQAYTINVVDTLPQQVSTAPKYRTYVRVSFEDEEQRQKPAACWQLWKEGRGTNEAHQRGGKLQAVEFVESNQSSGAEDPSKPRVELESYSFDGFCVVWTPPAGVTECPLSVRFNFLSTDFSHSKGVKGVPVRLCAKTELINQPTVSAQVSEVCYCRVKLFRDHGAERKLSNDVAHVKKAIDKLNQQIANIEAGMKDGKRKRSGSGSKGAYDQRPGKVLKHKRTWSSGSGGSGGRSSVEDDMHSKLLSLQDMFTSTRPASVLHLKGSEQDDPDLFPIKLTGDSSGLVRTESTETAGWERRSSNAGPPSSIVSPVPSLRSLSGSRLETGMQQPTPITAGSRMNSNDWLARSHSGTKDTHPGAPHQLASPPDTQTVKVKTVSGSLVEAAGIDPTYQAPPERKIKPVACFFVKLLKSEEGSTTDYYRAVYLTTRSLEGLTNAIALKFNMEPTLLHRLTRVTTQGLHVLLDDESVMQLPEGQDMTAEFCESTLDLGASFLKSKREWDAGSTDVQFDNDFGMIDGATTDGYELQLRF
ncbi:hypothetical protein K431DRAFT_325539 [Polychaeton citri CBS 116435]|uniref:Grh/CP2 DB domain-containing protein n=1 Tax=Polychaeton citri CBS 116435 TaxID=1314669 RepID=A0A9P4QF02_9PEZI|nr:hypothetical protein K431DRAFT_325539 [Polychaeton citri CBS 116435]